MNTLQLEIERVQGQIKQNQDIIDGDNSTELKEMAKEEIEKLQDELNSLQISLNTMSGEFNGFENSDDSVSNIQLNPNVAVIEIRGGIGGDEAGLFANDLYRMYSRFGEMRGWKFEEIFRSENASGGLKTVSAEIRGTGVYDLLKNESGVHRVQRIPVTEAAGRIHTSTATVAILPKLKNVNIEIRQDELLWEFYRAGGHGGQNVNKVSTAVRLTHIPTGTVIECQEERYQGKNREKALEILKSKLYSMMQEQNVKSITDLRSSQVGSGERNEKIRTYNYPQNRVTDHRINKDWYNLSQIIDGNIENMLEECDSLLVRDDTK